MIIQDLYKFYLLLIRLLAIGDLVVGLCISTVLVIYWYTGLLDVSIDDTIFGLVLWNIPHIFSWALAFCVDGGADGAGYALFYFVVYLLAILGDVTAIVWRFYIIQANTCTWTSQLFNDCSTISFLDALMWVACVVWGLIDFGQLAFGSRAMRANAYKQAIIREEKKVAPAVFAIEQLVVNKVDMATFNELSWKRAEKIIRRRFSAIAKRDVLKITGIFEFWVILLIIILTSLQFDNYPTWLLWLVTPHFFGWAFTLGVGYNVQKKSILFFYLILELASFVGDSVSSALKTILNDCGLFTAECSTILEIFTLLHYSCQLLLWLLSLVQLILSYQIYLDRLNPNYKNIHLD